MLARLHSDLLLLVVRQLTQVVDVARLSVSYRAIREKILLIYAPLFERAKKRYGSADLEKSFSRAVTDQQQHFIDRLRWIDRPDVELKGLLKRGDPLLLRKRMREPRFQTAKTLLEPPGYASNFAIVDYLLEEWYPEPRSTGLTCALCSNLALGGAKTGNLTFLRTLLAREPLVSHCRVCTCPSVPLVIGAAKSQNMDVVRWVAETFRPSLAGYESLVSLGIFKWTKEQSRYMHERYEFPLDKQMLVWFLAGDSELIRAHWDMLQSVQWPWKRHGTPAIYAMRNGHRQVAELALRLTPKLSASKLAVQSRNEEMILLYSTSNDALKAYYSDPDVLRTVLDRFGSKAKGSHVRQLFEKYTELSQLYLLAKRYPAAAKLAAKSEKRVALGRVLAQLGLNR